MWTTPEPDRYPIVYRIVGFVRARIRIIGIATVSQRKKKMVYACFAIGFRLLHWQLELPLNLLRFAPRGLCRSCKRNRKYVAPKSLIGIFEGCDQTNEMCNNSIYTYII